MAKKDFIVSVDIPKGVTIAEMQQYIEDTVGGWSGGLDPREPIFELTMEDVTVTRRKDNESV